MLALESTDFIVPGVPQKSIAKICVLRYNLNYYECKIALWPRFQFTAKDFMRYD